MRIAGQFDFPALSVFTSDELSGGLRMIIFKNSGFTGNIDQSWLPSDLMAKKETIDCFLGKEKIDFFYSSWKYLILFIALD